MQHAQHVMWLEFCMIETDVDPLIPRFELPQKGHSIVSTTYPISLSVAIYNYQPRLVVFGLRDSRNSEPELSIDKHVLHRTILITTVPIELVFRPFWSKLSINRS